MTKPAANQNPPRLRDVVDFTDDSGKKLRGRVVGLCAPDNLRLYDIFVAGQERPRMYVPAEKVLAVVERYRAEAA